MKTPKAIKHDQTGMPWRHRFLAGKNTGLELESVNITMENGEQAAGYICNKRPGYFRQVFVEWDSEIPPFPE